MIKLFKIIFFLLIISCKNKILHKGYPTPELIKNKIHIGNTKEQVLSVLSYPSIESEDTQIWYYIRFNGKEEIMVSFVPYEKISTEIHFKNNLVTNIQTTKVALVK